MAALKPPAGQSLYSFNPPEPVRQSTVLQRAPAPDDTRWSNKSVVLDSVRRNGRSLRHASEEMRADKEVVIAALKNDPASFEYAADCLRADRQFLLEEALLASGWALRTASEDLRHDRDVVLAFAKHWGWSWDFVPEALKKDRELTLEAVKLNGWVLKFCPSELQKDREIVVEAVQHEGFALQFASAALRADEEVAALAIANDPNAKEFVIEPKPRPVKLSEKGPVRLS
eukprot:TRINITY_DN32271_c0_g1_i2.p1 TRINITY_DN32271_c0_g1~~TRINITY_DN32271_c0_g1_i2.p1  ORF type:complete len:229 (+),score=56.27 TRINITY_DN32271_c0_g1_i2:107-793(+)